MKLSCRQLLKVAVAVLGFAAPLFPLEHGAWSQTVRTAKVVVAAPPGGASDVLARLMSEQIGRAEAVTMIVENRPGASTTIGTEAAARAAPDGKTLLVVTPPFVINPLLRKLNYDPLTSFEPICNLVRSPLLIVVNSASPYHTLGDLLNAARAKSGDLTLAGAGPATALHLAFEMLKRAANVNMTFVPYPGDAPAVNALLGEHVTSAFTPYPGLAEQLKAGKLRALATASRVRDESLPNIPTVAESGFKDYETDFWQGVVAPANTPKETVSQMVGWFTAALQVPEVKTKLVSLGLYPVGTCGADFAALLRKQYYEFGRVIREANIRVE
jgi:tripartite-type tricarboxylate transporter receptor subunit TctC